MDAKDEDKGQDSQDKEKPRQLRRRLRGKKDITKEQFHSLVKKAAQPVKDTSESGSASPET